MAPKAKMMARPAAKVRPMRVMRHAAAKVRPMRVARGAAAKAATKRAARKRPAANIPSGHSEPLRNLDGEKISQLGQVVLKDAHYYHRAVEACGRVLGMRFDGGQMFLDFQVTGTRDEDLLRVLSGRKPRVLSVHACADGCGGELSAEDMVHAKSYREVRGPLDPWMSNLESVAGEEAEEDENKRLREEARLRLEETGGKEPPKKKDKKEKKKKKKEDGDKSEDEGGKKKEESDDDKEPGQRPLGAVFKRTGLDPEWSRRKKVLKKAKRLGKSKKKKKKKKGSGSSYSQEETSSSSDDASLDGDLNLFNTERKMKKIWNRCPGALSAAAIGEAKKHLVTSAGNTMSMDKRSLPPIMSQYARQVVTPGMSPPLTQEVLSVALAIDYLMVGRVAGACDVLCQRMKSLESLGRGNHWAEGRQLELMRGDGAGLADEEESRAAAKQAREEERLRALTQRPYGSRGNEPNQGGKGKKGKEGKDAKGNAKGTYGDSGRGKKGDGKKEDNKQSWQKKE